MTAIQAVFAACSVLAWSGGTGLHQSSIWWEMQYECSTRYGATLRSQQSGLRGELLHLWLYDMSSCRIYRSSGRTGTNMSLEIWRTIRTYSAIKTIRTWFHAIFKTIYYIWLCSFCSVLYSPSVDFGGVSWVSSEDEGFWLSSSFFCFCCFFNSLSTHLLLSPLCSTSTSTSIPNGFRKLATASPTEFKYDCAEKNILLNW